MARVAAQLTARRVKEVVASGITDAAAGYAALVRRWLWSLGPGTEADLLERRAIELTAWLAGEIVRAVFQSPLIRADHAARSA